MRIPLVTALLTVTVAAALLHAASAKDLGPGDVRVCNATRCVDVESRPAVKALAALIYTGSQPAVALPPSLGVPSFQLRFRNGYTMGIVATRRLDRFLSYGVVLERFRRGRWYAVPERASADLRRLTARLEPLRLTAAAVRKSR